MTEEETDFVYYAAGDYAGFLRRVLALVGDLAGLFVIVCGIIIACALAGIAGQDLEHLPRWLNVVLLVVAYLYLTLLKRSRIRTPGYWVTGLRIVNLKGNQPSLFVMTVRLLWWVLGPINPVLDLFFMASESHRQTIRDKLFGTYVIQRNARPAGHGRRAFCPWSFMGFMFTFQEVKPVGPSGGGGGE